MPYDKEKAKSEYSQKLRDPRWQKLRLEVMQRDEFTCQYCFDSTTTLNVHHTYYDCGADPWDYPPESLITLCEACHESETAQRPITETTLLRALKFKGWSAFHINELAEAINRGQRAWDPLVSALCWAIEDQEMAHEIFAQYRQYLHRTRIARESANTITTGDPVA